MSQNETIFNHLTEVGSISPIEALIVHGVSRLAARINDLRDLGYAIKSTMSADMNGRRYCRYTLND
jgi:hypothetical protein